MLAPIAIVQRCAAWADSCGHDDILTETGLFPQTITSLRQLIVSPCPKRIFFCCSSRRPQKIQLYVTNVSTLVRFTSAVGHYESVCDVPMAGLLAGLPALCANGLFSGFGKHLSLPKGFYSALHILLTLGFMALGRIRRPEGLRHIAPGEFGKVIGLDRVPEVRTLREKTGLLAAAGNTQAWMQDLSKRWMQADPAEAGYLYVDGHVRVYDGEGANLPRRFVSRERLCLRGTAD